MAARLSLATGKQTILALIGQEELGEERERFERENQLLLLPAGRTGGR